MYILRISHISRLWDRPPQRTDTEGTTCMVSLIKIHREDTRDVGTRVKMSSECLAYLAVWSVLAYDEISTVPLPSSIVHAQSECSPPTALQLTPRATLAKHNSSKRRTRYMTTISEFVTITIISSPKMESGHVTPCCDLQFLSRDHGVPTIILKYTRP